MTENEISYKVIGAIYKVYNELSPCYWLSAGSIPFGHSTSGY
jgi:hypothetical protein